MICRSYSRIYRKRVLVIWYTCDNLLQGTAMLAVNAYNYSYQPHYNKLQIFPRKVYKR